MSKRTPVRVLLAGTALSVSLAACGKSGEVEASPPDAPPINVDRPPTANPPPPIRPEEPPEEVVLPSWDDVASGHPEGATNPPSPFLRVTPEGDCYKFWRGMMAPPRPGEVIGDRVEECPEDCGTQIVCPEPRTQQLLDAQDGEAPKKTPPVKPEGL